MLNETNASIILNLIQIVYGFKGPKARPDKRSEPYKEIVRENPQFIEYYKVWI